MNEDHVYWIGLALLIVAGWLLLFGTRGMPW